MYLKEQGTGYIKRVLDIFDRDDVAALHELLSLEREKGQIFWQLYFNNADSLEPLVKDLLTWSFALGCHEITNYILILHECPDCKQQDGFGFCPLRLAISIFKGMRLENIPLIDETDSFYSNFLNKFSYRVPMKHLSMLLLILSCRFENLDYYSANWHPCEQELKLHLEILRVFLFRRGDGAYEYLLGYVDLVTRRGLWTSSLMQWMIEKKYTGSLEILHQICCQRALPHLLHCNLGCFCNYLRGSVSLFSLTLPMHRQEKAVKDVIDEAVVSALFQGGDFQSFMIFLDNDYQTRLVLYRLGFHCGQLHDNYTFLLYFVAKFDQRFQKNYYRPITLCLKKMLNQGNFKTLGILFRHWKDIKFYMDRNFTSILEYLLGIDNLYGFLWMSRWNPSEAKSSLKFLHQYLNGNDISRYFCQYPGGVYSNHATRGLSADENLSLGSDLFLLLFLIREGYLWMKPGYCEKRRFLWIAGQVPFHAIVRYLFGGFKKLSEETLRMRLEFLL